MMSSNTTSQKESGVPNEVELYLVREARTKTRNYMKKVILLEDSNNDTYLVQMGTDVRHLSRDGVRLNSVQADDAEVTLWDQGTCIIAERFTTTRRHDLLEGSTISTWNFRTNEPSLSKSVNLIIACIQSIQFRGHSTKLLIVGTRTGEVHLMRFPTFEIVHTFDSPSKHIEVILPLDDGDSFACGFSCQTLVLWRSTSTKDEERVTTSNLNFSRQLLVRDRTDNELEYYKLAQVNRKLVSYFADSSGRKTVRVFDISSGQCLSEVAERSPYPSLLLGVGNGELLVTSYHLNQWDALSKSIDSKLFGDHSEHSI